MGVAVILRTSTRRRSPMALVALLACLVLAVGFTVQTAILVHTVLQGVKQDRRVDWAFLKHAAQVMPQNATFASNATGGGYVLFPRTVVKANFRLSPTKLRAALHRRGTQFLVLVPPLPDSLAGSGTWTHQLYRGTGGVVLAVR